MNTAYYSSSLPDNIKSKFSSDDFFVFPGFCDVHVHFREPGFVYKESIATGSKAGAHGGYTAVCTMPNLDPVPDSVCNIQAQLDIIERDALINVYPYAAITLGQFGRELVDMKSLAPHAIAFSDDGRGVQDADIMRRAMTSAKSAGKIIAAHCEDDELVNGGYIHKGEYAKTHNHKGICSESEWGPIQRDINLVRETGCAYHVCHVSAKESVELIRQAKAEGLDVTCETAPHYLLLSDEDLQEDGRYKMNPPLRSADDRQALIDGILDGTIDMIATDHAPHSVEEKSRGFENSLFGISGIDVAFPLLYTHLVKTGIVTLDLLLELLVHNPRRRFNIPDDDGFSIWNLNEEYSITEEDFLSKGKSSPFIGTSVFGRCVLTSCNGNIVYDREQDFHR